MTILDGRLRGVLKEDNRLSEYPDVSEEELVDIKERATAALADVQSEACEDPIFHYWHFSDWLLNIFGLLQTIENLKERLREHEFIKRNI